MNATDALSDSLSSEAPERRRLRAYAIATAVWFAVFVILPADLQGVWFLAFGLCSIGLIFHRATRLRGTLQRPLAMLGLAGGASLASSIVREIHGALSGVPSPFPSPADLLVFASYGLFVGAILVVVHRRVRRLGPDPWLDAAVAGVAAAILQWTTVVIPYLSSPGVTPAEAATNIAYSVLSLSLVFAAVLALVVGNVPAPANRLLALGLIATFAADPVSVLVTNGTLPASASIAVVALAFALGTTGILHPTVRLLTARPDNAELGQRLTRRRLSVLTLALFTPPLLLLRAALARDTGIEFLLPALASLALTPIVLVRLGRLVRQNERFAAIERTLRGVGERLVSAERVEDVATVVTVGLEQVLGGRLLGGGLLLEPATEDRTVPAPVRAAITDLLADPAPGGLATGRIHRVATAAGGEPDHGREAVWEVGLIVVQRVPKAVLVAATKGGMDAPERNAFVTLCRDASIAIRAVEQTELAVRLRAEERFAALVDNSSDIVVIVDHDGRLSYVSPVADRLLGYQGDPVSLSDALDLVHPDDRDRAAGLLRDIRFGNEEPRELRLRHASGEYRWFEIVGVDLQSDPNIRGVVLNAREISDRKAAEERLQLSEARFRALVQHSTDLVLVVDARDGVRYASPAAHRTLGEDPEALLGRPLEAVFGDSGVDWDTALRKASGSGEDDPELMEFGFRNACGDWVHVEATVTDLRSEEAVGGFVLNVRDVTERTTMLQRLRYQATHDDLTGLPNRVLATEELTGMLARNGGASTVAVISVDLDDFKDVNDSLGHGLGDRLLLAVANRLRESLAFGDVAARVGGDEFVIVLERAHGEDRVLEVAQSILSGLSKPFVLEGRELSVTASAGVAYDHDRSTPAEVLLRNADTAMYRAKQLGKRQVVVFEAHMHTASFDRLELRADLARALETDQFMAFYQPILDLDTHKVIGAEALVRWQHPRRGLLSPAVFVPLAEESGLIAQLGEWMLERACRDLAGWRRELPEEARDLLISVNLSAQEVHSDRLVPAVLEILQRTGVPADHLVLEVTESNLLDDTEVVRDRMQRLRELGTLLAIDDFGTGYSSLGYIQRFAFDVLKIDRSFVEGLDRSTNRRIVTAVLDLARELDVRVVAEGIEEEAQEDVLVDLGCRFGQGYLYSRPIPAPEFRKLLVAERARVG
jgi:diguanylate cyclase (GGDEF)-like protein/PAS domain S-box-containing protein